MKLKIVAALLMTFTSASAYSQGCSSVDAELEIFQKGLRNAGDVARAILCNIENTAALNSALCGTVVGIRKDLLKQTQELVKVGEKTQADVDAAQVALNAAEKNCPL